jgi:hypothetical protein
MYPVGAVILCTVHCAALVPVYKTLKLLQKKAGNPPGEKPLQL